jgi:hypothetical protein
MNSPVSSRPWTGGRSTSLLKGRSYIVSVFVHPPASGTAGQFTRYAAEPTADDAACDSTATCPRSCFATDSRAC